jgi:hypothetical protein
MTIICGISLPQRQVQKFCETILRAPPAGDFGVPPPRCPGAAPRRIVQPLVRATRPRLLFQRIHGRPAFTAKWPSSSARPGAGNSGLRLVLQEGAPSAGQCLRNSCGLLILLRLFPAPAAFGNAMTTSLCGSLVSLAHPRFAARR